MHIYNSPKSRFMQLNFIFNKVDLFTMDLFIFCKTKNFTVIFCLIFGCKNVIML